MNLVDALLLKELKGVGDTTVNKLLEFSLAHNLSSLEELIPALNLCNTLKRIPKNIAQLLETNDYLKNRILIENNINKWREKGVSVIHLGSSLYPPRLLHLESPPPFLFCKGNAALLNETRAIAVVGTRENSNKGAMITAKTVKAFGERGFTIVSGLALGIDTIAHRAALDYAVSTISVLVDIEKVTPRTNQLLAEEIINSNGLLVSENPPGISVVPALFAKRDRIQSGLSTAVFAIETSKNGGTMHAVRHAKVMNRPVFVPDPHAARYQDLSVREIEGTQYLVESGSAKSYTSESYEKIASELTSIAKQINFSNANDSNGQGNLLL